jgi:tetratricopeptide (TPR) repeat protein
VLLATAAAYAPALANDFVLEDRALAMARDGERCNPLVAELRPLEEYLRGAAGGGSAAPPAATLSFALRHALVGDDPAAAHALNLLLHVLATALVYGLVRGLRVEPGSAALAALAFGLHAIHTDAVVPVAGRAELLAFCGGAGALLLLVAGRALRPAAWRPLCWLLAAASLALALAASAGALAWVPFAACYGLGRQWRGRWRHGWLRPALLADAAALAAPAAAWLWLRSAALAQPAAAAANPSDFLANPLIDAEPAARLLGGSLAWGLGLLQICLPLWPAADWGAAVLPLPDGLADPAALLGAAAAAGLLVALVAAVAWCQRQPLAFVAAACFLALGFATSNLAFPAAALLAERCYYAPSLALSIAVPWAAERLARLGQTALLLAAGVWLGASALVLVQRTVVWHDDETLILHEVDHQPRSVRMRREAARLHRRRGELQAARRHLEQAVELDPGCAAAWHELGDTAAQAGRDEVAIVAYGAALHGRRAELGAVEAVVRGKLALLLGQLGEHRRALGELAACFLIDPEHCRAQPALAELAARLASSADLTPRARGEAARLRAELAAPPAGVERRPEAAR